MTQAVAVLEISRDGSHLPARELRNGETVRVGRIAPNELVLADAKVSRFHAAISASETGLVVGDFGSLNGTFVNGRRISTPQTVASGDIISVGDYLIKVRLLTSENAADQAVVSTQAAEMKAVVITVMLADICSYTKISAACPPTEVTAVMQRWFSAASNIVRDFGGDVDKYIGDCVMSLWRGARDSAEEQARAAMRAGEAIQRETLKLARSGFWKHEEEHPFRCRIALNSGDALMGTIGGSERRDFTVVGDSVNVAFKIEDKASELKSDFVLSEATAKLVSAEFKLRELGHVTIEGRSGSVHVFTREGPSLYEC